MDILDIIEKKKNKQELTMEELDYAFNGFLNKKIPDYQMSALLMAIVINGMTLEETVNLTELFIKSGDTYDLSDISYTVDKHSTGGVGDSVTLVLGPICAAMGLHMAKMSGRGLGFTGGTADKLDSIPGFNVDLTKEEFLRIVQEVGFANTAQTNDLCPMDKVVYALRDVTGTTESIPLIASSIMSKKIAAGAKNILIDVKYGTGALMKAKEDAEILADWLTKIGEAHGRRVKTVLSDMNVPLSYAIGNILEVVEAMNVLKGKECPLLDTSLDIAAELYTMAHNSDYNEALELAKKTIEDGSAYKKFLDFVKAQGGRIDEIRLTPNVVKVHSKKTGVVQNIDALGAAKLAAKLGASKATLDDKIDFRTGILLHVKVGDQVNKDDIIMSLYIGDKKVSFKNEDFNFINIV